MPVKPGAEIDLTIEKPAAGGRMIARHEGQVVLVAGAIPGERVRARIGRADKRLAFASVVDLLEPSPDRRDTPQDPLCGGCLYAHIRYDRQLALKSEVIADAFSRIGKLPLDAAVAVAASPERGYRMRARFHVRGDSVGFFREGSHDICNALATGQLPAPSTAAVAAAAASLAADGSPAISFELTENIAADERALHADLVAGAKVSEPALARAASAAAARGCTARTSGGMLVSAGDPTVADPFALLTAGRATAGELRRHAESFFQANRFLLPSLVTRVLEEVPDDGDVVDLYAGVGLFSLALASCGRRRITAVEGDGSSGADLERNAAQFADAVRVIIGRVEDHAASRGPAAETILVDPPRTGISKEAVEALASRGARRIVYVSCDAPTMARDARRLVDAGYRIGSLRGFDLFPNTPHVETVGVFLRG
jgi:23S rRNA (uracil1939-C5)-methyltransferase